MDESTYDTGLHGPTPTGQHGNVSKVRNVKDRPKASNKDGLLGGEERTEDFLLQFQPTGSEGWLFYGRAQDEEDAARVIELQRADHPDVKWRIRKRTITERTLIA